MTVISVYFIVTWLAINPINGHEIRNEKKSDFEVKYTNRDLIADGYLALWAYPEKIVKVETIMVPEESNDIYIKTKEIRTEMLKPS